MNDELTETTVAPTEAAAGPTETTVESLLKTLLWEGYALYPYTPGATKNRTPTPYGIVYPPVYAAGSAHTFDRSQVQVVLRPGPAAAVSATVAFLEPSGERHEGVERRIEFPSTPVAALAESAINIPFEYDAITGRAELSVSLLMGGLVRVTLSVENNTPVEEGLDRKAALVRSMLNAHLILQAQDGKFVSPISPESDAEMAHMSCNSVNTFPVLATAADDAVLGTTIMLHDHPQLAPESQHDFFDSTEIEEALMIHVVALSDGERAIIAEQDPKVAAMIEKAAASTAEDFARVRGRVTITDPADSKEPLSPVGGPIPDFADELVNATTGPDPLADDGPVEGLGGPMFRPRPGGVPTGPNDAGGEAEIEHEGITYRRGEKVRLRPEFGRAAQDLVWADRVATIERILIDHDDDIHICVTVDDDPGQALMRDMGRYLYFKPSEVEVLSS